MNHVSQEAVLGLAQNLELFIKVFRSLNPGGRIVIRDHVMEPDRTNPRDGGVFAVNMLLSTSGGKPIRRVRSRPA